MWSWSVGFSTSNCLIFKAAIWQVVGNAQAHLVLSHFADGTRRYAFYRRRVWGRLLLRTPWAPCFYCMCSQQAAQHALVPRVGDPCGGSGFFMTVLFVTVTWDQ